MFRKCPRRLRLSAQNAPEGPHEDPHESAPGKFDSAYPLFVRQSELTEFFAELTEFAPKLSEAQ